MDRLGVLISSSPPALTARLPSRRHCPGACHNSGQRRPVTAVAVARQLQPTRSVASSLLLPAQRAGAGSSRRLLPPPRATTALPMDGAPLGVAAITSIDSLDALQVSFDNNTDPACTIITVEARDRAVSLADISGPAITGLDLILMSATTTNTQLTEGRVLFVLRVQTSDRSKVPQERWDAVRGALQNLTACSSRSSQPAIYGEPAKLEVMRLKTIAESGDVAEKELIAFELAAAEISVAAADVVRLERQVVELSKLGVEARLVSEREAARAEAAAVFERKMGAMEALMAARRTVSIQPEPKSAEEALKEQMLAAVAPPSTSGSGPAAGSGYEILLQAFNWESHKRSWYKECKSRVKDWASLGFTSIWLPPPSDSVSPQGYLPRDLYQLDSCYGSEAELRELIAECHQFKIKVLADIVINHRCAHQQGNDGKWNKFGGRLAWDSSAICNNNPAWGGRGNRKTGDDYPAAPNIDHTQERVRNDIINWLQHLRKSVGFDGWRFDFTRGYAGSYCKTYIDATVPEMAIGEYWDACEYSDGVLNYNQDSHRQRAVNWCDSTGGTSAAFDFTTKGILQEALGRTELWRLVDATGRPPGMVGMWPSRAITFIDNHDTGSTLNHWPFPSQHLQEGYAYILTHPGTPCVFYDHLYDERGGLRKVVQDLVALRRRLQINCRSAVVVRKAAGDVYAATVDNKISVKIGRGDWSPNSARLDVGQKEWKLVLSGSGWAVWEAMK